MYQQLCHDSLLLGALDQFGRAVHLIGRQVTTLVQSPRFQSVLTVGSKLLRAPIPEGKAVSEALEAWHFEKYLPPFIDLSAAYHSARQQWERAPAMDDPDHVTLGELGAGWKPVPPKGNASSQK
jgi:hypothetical protein